MKRSVGLLLAVERSYCTCKVSVWRSPGSELCHQLPIWLEDEDTAGFIVNSDDVSVLIHSHAFRSHQSSSANFVLWQPHAKVWLLCVWSYSVNTFLFGWDHSPWTCRPRRRCLSICCRSQRRWCHHSCPLWPLWAAEAALVNDLWPQTSS